MRGRGVAGRGGDASNKGAALRTESCGRSAGHPPGEEGGGVEGLACARVAARLYHPTAAARLGATPAPLLVARAHLRAFARPASAARAKGTSLLPAPEARVRAQQGRLTRIKGGGGISERGRGLEGGARALNIAQESPFSPSARSTCQSGVRRVRRVGGAAGAPRAGRSGPPRFERGPPTSNACNSRGHGRENSRGGGGGDLERLRVVCLAPGRGGGRVGGASARWGDAAGAKGH